jgi:3-hydroxybutyryl-CoA dehydratase
MAEPPRAYFEDVELHGVVETPAVTLTQAHVSLYAGLSQELAPAPGLVPELLPLCLTTGLGWRIPRAPLAVLAFMGFEWEVIHPVRIGDTIHSRSKTAVKRSMRDGGVIVEERQVINQRGEVVHRGKFTFLVAKRPT